MPKNDTAAGTAPASAPAGHNPPERAAYPTVTRVAAVGAAVLFGGLAAFQLALALGAPWGRAAYGGFVEQPGVELRVSSGVATVIWSLAALVILRRAGYRVWAPLPDRALPATVWVLAGVTTFAVLPNLVTPSGLERAIWAPVSVGMAALAFTVAITARRRGRAGA
jgi:hypothetical protein